MNLPALDTRDRRADLGSIAEQLAALRRMTVHQLAQRYLDVYGEPTRSRNKSYLEKKVAFRIQELAEGGLSKEARGRLAALSNDLPPRWRAAAAGRALSAEEVASATPAAMAHAAAAPARDPRLPPDGGVLVRRFKGREHHVRVLAADAFEYEGRRYPSLSAIAKEISGTPWNGFSFFKLNRPSSPVEARG